MRNNPQKSTPRYIIIKLLKPKAIEKPWKYLEINDILPLQEHEFKWQHSSYRKPQKPEWRDTIFSTCWKNNCLSLPLCEVNRMKKQTHLSIIYLIANSLNMPHKRHRLEEKIQMWQNYIFYKKCDLNSIIWIGWE